MTACGLGGLELPASRLHDGFQDLLLVLGEDEPGLGEGRMLSQAGRLGVNPEAVKASRRNPRSSSRGTSFRKSLSTASRASVRRGTSPWDAASTLNPAERVPSGAICMWERREDAMEDRRAAALSRGLRRERRAAVRMARASTSRVSNFSASKRRTTTIRASASCVRGGQQRRLAEPARAHEEELPASPDGGVHEGQLLGPIHQLGSEELPARLERIAHRWKRLSPVTCSSSRSSRHDISMTRST
jgi:hypothetical protein